MTREERERMRRQSAAILANAQGNFSAPPENMLSQSAGGPDLLAQMNQDFTGREDAIAAQRAQAAAMMGQGPAEGKQMGDLYFAPTWSEIAANAAKDVAGGLSQRSANKQAAALGLEKAKAKEAGTLYEEEKLQEDRDYKSGETDRLIGSREDIAELGRQNTAQMQEDRFQKDAIRDKRALGERKRKEVTRKMERGDAQMDEIQKLGPAKTMYDKDGKPVQVATDYQGSPVDPNTRESIDTTGLDSKSPRTGRNRGLTDGQVQIGLRNLSKELKPVEDVIGAVEQLDDLLLPYYGQEDIPGLGRIEGQGNLLGKGARALGTFFDEDDPGEQIYQSRTRLVRNFIKESAGLAQTLSEVQGVLESYGLDNLQDEKTFMEAYPKIKSALKADLARISASTVPGVRDQFAKGYEGDPSKNPLTYQPRTLEQQALAQQEGGAVGLTPEKAARLKELRELQAAGLIE